MTATKKGLEPSLKEAYGNRLNNQANRAAPRVLNAGDKRMCVYCGKTQSGPYCPKCGQATVAKRGAVTGTKKPPKPAMVGFPTRR